MNVKIFRAKIKDSLIVWKRLYDEKMMNHNVMTPDIITCHRTDWSEWEICDRLTDRKSMEAEICHISDYRHFERLMMWVIIGAERAWGPEMTATRTSAESRSSSVHRAPRRLTIGSDYASSPRGENLRWRAESSMENIFPYVRDNVLSAGDYGGINPNRVMLYCLRYPAFYTATLIIIIRNFIWNALFLHNKS